MLFGSFLFYLVYIYMYINVHNILSLRLQMVQFFFQYSKCLIGYFFIEKNYYFCFLCLRSNIYIIKSFKIKFIYFITLNGLFILYVYIKHIKQFVKTSQSNNVFLHDINTYHENFIILKLNNYISF